MRQYRGGVGRRISGADTVRGVLLAMGLVLFGAVAPQAQAQSENYSFSSIAIEGNQRIETPTILRYVDIARGEAVTAGQLNDAYQSLINSGLFESVELVPSGNRLVIRVEEFPTINVINFEGNRRINDETLAGVVDSQPRRVYSPSQAEADAAAIAEAYRQSGRFSAAVNPVIIERSDNRVDLVFEIREGRVIEIERLSFVGNRDFSDRRLRRVLETKQAGLLRRLIQRDTFLEERIEFDKQVLRDFYASRGYVDFRILSVTSEFSRERNAFFLTFRIEEGQSFDFGQLTASSDLPEIDPAEYRALLTIRPGVTYSPTLLDRAIARMERYAIQQGLNFIRVDPQITRNPETRTLDVDFQIVQGERVFVERIDIEGNTTTLDRVIRRQFNTVEGDPFNPRAIRQSAERIRALGFFGRADVETREGTRPQSVIVDVDVEEQPTGSLGFGLSYGTDQGVGASVNFSETNFLGRGQTLRFSIESGTSSQDSELTFIEPAFLDRDLELGLSLSYRTTTDDEFASYDTKRIRFSPSLEFPVSEYGRLGVRYFVAEDEISNVSGNLSPVIAADEGSAISSGIGYTYSFDTRGRGLDPTRGVVLRFSQDVAGLGGDQEYIKTTALAGVERKILNEEVTLRAEIEGGALTMLSGESRVSDRFFLSSRQMRGFEYLGLGPREQNGIDEDDALGGNFYSVARIEAAFPLGLPEEYGISGGVFADFGSVWGLDYESGFGSPDSSQFDDEFAIRSAIGFSVFWDTAIGPLRFNFSKALQKEDYDRERNFDLTIQTRF